MNIPKAVRINLSITAVIITVLFFALKPYKVNTVPPPVQVIKIAEPDKREQKISMAMWDVAKVFGRAGAGCKDATPELGRMVAEVSVNEGQEPNLVAAIVSVESDCNPYATSSRGAVGLMQVMASVHKSTYDFQNKVNLFNEKENVETGTKILAGYIKAYGREDGILHYQGTGTGCQSCDGLYTVKILRLADGK
jgi:hypothetical protein